MKAPILYFFLSISFLLSFAQDKALYFFHEFDGKTYYLSATDEGELVAKVVQNEPGEKETFFLFSVSSQDTEMDEEGFQPYYIKTPGGFYLDLEEEQLVVVEKTPQRKHVFMLDMEWERTIKEVKQIKSDNPNDGEIQHSIPYTFKSYGYSIIKQVEGEEEWVIYFSNEEEAFVAREKNESGYPSIQTQAVRDGVESSLVSNPNSPPHVLVWRDSAASADSISCPLEIVANFALTIRGDFYNSKMKSDTSYIDWQEGEAHFYTGRLNGTEFIKIWNRSETNQVLSLGKVTLSIDFNFYSWDVDETLQPGEGVKLYADHSGGIGRIFRKIKSSQQ